MSDPGYWAISRKRGTEETVHYVLYSTGKSLCGRLRGDRIEKVPLDGGEWDPGDPITCGTCRSLAKFLSSSNKARVKATE